MHVLALLGATGGCGVHGILYVYTKQLTKTGLAGPLPPGLYVTALNSPAELMAVCHEVT